MNKLATLNFKMIYKHTHRVAFIVLIEVGAISSMKAFANIYGWPGICRLIYVIQIKMS